VSEHTCSVPACDRAARSRGWCEAHLDRWRRHGDVQADRPIRPRRAPNPGAPCEVNGCSNPRYIRGNCQMHHSRFMRHGKVGSAEAQKVRRWEPDTACSVVECGRSVMAVGLCQAHYWRKQRHDDVMADVPVHKAVAPKGSACMKPDCSSPVVALGICRRHYSVRKAAEARADPALWEALRTYHREFKAAEYARDPARVRARHRAWKVSNPARVKLSDAKKRRQRRRAHRLPFSVDQLADRIRYWGFRCWICRAPYEAIDHVKPLNKGGWHMLANLRPICTSCNSRKHDHWPYTVPTAIRAANRME
jgi:5-methylcytosine-specific restriction endonuclease McrA